MNDQNPVLRANLDSGGEFVAYAPATMTKAEWRQIQGMCAFMAGDWVKFGDDSVECRPEDAAP